MRNLFVLAAVACQSPTPEMTDTDSPEAWPLDDDGSCDGDGLAVQIDDTDPSAGAWGRYCEDDSCHALLYGGETFTEQYAIDLAGQTVGSARIGVRMTLDDHDNELAYCLTVAVNGHEVVVEEPLSGVPHGAPFRGPFDNFVIWELPVDPEVVQHGENEVSFTLGCEPASNNWVVFDWSGIEVVCD